MRPVIAITMGDPGGIGPEIIVKSLSEIKFGKAIYIVIGSEEVFEFASKKLNLPFRPNVVPAFEVSHLQPNQINLLDVTQEARMLYEKTFKTDLPSEKFSIGTVSRWNAALSYSALKVAAYQGAYQLIEGLVTAPIHKLAMRLIDPKFSGHTEYLARIAEVKDYAMMFISDRLRVTLATIHVPLKKVSQSLSLEGLISKIVLTDSFLKRKLKINRPKIGVAALNPHGSEFGDEEENLIVPAIKKAAQKEIRVEGPLPGDQIFNDAYEGRLDAVVAMYHDQGLGPFKMISFRDGVNVTLGLPYMRTSPDHGTAFDIAYKNKAFHSAFTNSIRLIERTSSCCPTGIGPDFQ